MLTILAEFTSDFSGSKLSIVGFELSSRNELPYGVLQVKLNVSEYYGAVIDNATKIPSQYHFEAYAKFFSIEFKGIPVCSTVISSLYRLGQELIFPLPISLEALRYIEENRKDDLSFFIIFEFSYLEIAHMVKRSKESQLSGSFHFEYKLTASEWVKLLADLKYSNKMLIEIDVPDISLPKLKGIDEVTKMIESANYKLLQRANPEDIISDLRSTWDIMDKFISEFDKRIEEHIDKDSKEEKKYDKKSDRIEKITKSVGIYINSITEMKRNIDNLVQIGPHRDIYKSTMEDAELAFRLTVSLIAYYSTLLSKINKESD